MPPGLRHAGGLGFFQTPGAICVRLITYNCTSQDVAGKPVDPDEPGEVFSKALDEARNRCVRLNRGALYLFNWVTPTAIGIGGAGPWKRDLR